TFELGNQMAADEARRTQDGDQRTPSRMGRSLFLRRLVQSRLMAPTVGCVGGRSPLFASPEVPQRTKHGQAFGRSVLANATPCSTHEARSCSVFTPSGATAIHPSLVRPRISMREA